MGYIPLRCQLEVSYSASVMTYKEIAEIRLAQLGLGPIEAAETAGIPRDFIRDLIKDKKKSVRADGIEILARGLRLDPAALARKEIVPVDEAQPSQMRHGFADLAARVEKLDDEHVSLLGEIADAIARWNDKRKER